MVRVYLSLILCLVTLFSGDAFANKKKRLLAQQAAAQARCHQRVATGFGVALLAGATLIAGTLNWFPQTGGRAVTAQARPETSPVVERPISEPFIPTAQQQRHLQEAYSALLQAGEKGVTELDLFPSVKADPELSAIWERLKKFNYRIVGRVLEPEKDSAIYVYAKSNPDYRIILINLDLRRFGYMDPGFILANELYDLEFHHHVFDVTKVPTPFDDAFRNSADTFFTEHPEFQPMIPEALEPRSQFYLRSVLGLWMEKRSYLSQYDFYLRSRERFPELIRAHIDNEADQSDEWKKEHLLKHFSDPPYGIDPKLAAALWDWPLPEKFSYRKPR